MARSAGRSLAAPGTRWRSSSPGASRKWTSRFNKKDEIDSMKPSESLFVEIRRLRYHVRRWPRPGAPKLFFFHGWMDVGASFQFLVDELEGDWDVYAPDWRGYGLTDWGKSDCYWFPDYLADLEAILDAFEKD